MVDKPKCEFCGEELEDGDTFVSISGGTIHRTEPQSDAGGANSLHPNCAILYIKANYTS